MPGVTHPAPALNQAPPIHFFVIGAGKAGTSWLQVCLEKHPGVCVPAIKELHFFSKRFEEGWPWYTGQFAPSEGQLIGEISPTYLWHPDAAGRIAEAYPDARILAILRDPIERAYSNYCMHLSVEVADRDVDAVLVPGSEYVEPGLYNAHLERFRRHFPEQNVKAMLYDDLQRDGPAFLSEVLAFLGADASFLPAAASERFFVRKERKRLPGLHRFLVRRVARLIECGERPARWAHRLRTSAATRWYHRWNQSGLAYPKLSSEACERLIVYYRPDTQAIARRYEGSFPDWLDRPYHFVETSRTD